MRWPGAPRVAKRYRSDRFGMTTGSTRYNLEASSQRSSFDSPTAVLEMDEPLLFGGGFRLQVRGFSQNS
jgi:hypothetical protein